MTKGEFRQFLGQARGSFLELETQLDIARDLTYLAEQNYETLVHDTRQVLGLLNRLLESMRQTPSMKTPQACKVC